RIPWALASILELQAEDGIRDWSVTGVQTCALPISAFRTLPAFAAIVPRSWLLALGSAIGTLGYRLDRRHRDIAVANLRAAGVARSEEQPSELQSLTHLVCPLLLVKKKTTRRVQLPR